jgi:Glycolipid transfer protein (GLTP)
LNEKGEKKRTATEGLMWLVRGLAFTCQALNAMQADKSVELSAAFGRAYERTLKQFHNFVVKSAFAVALATFPYRADFYAKLAADPAGGPAVPEERLNAKLNEWLAALDRIVKRIEAFYEKGGYGKGF